MANKLYPPQIETSIPAMYSAMKGEDITLKVPFQFNRTVSSEDFDSIVAKITTISTGRIKGDDIIESYDCDNKVAKFTFASTDFTPGQYYKVQIAFKSTDGTIGYYSTVGIVKYLLLPNVTMDLNSSSTATNDFAFDWTGIYQTSDASEKIYSYCFTIYDINNNIFETSGDLLHNSKNDTSAIMSYDYWTSEKIPRPNETYYIEYRVKTINGLEISSALFKIKLSQTENFPSNDKEYFVATLYQDNGYIRLHYLGDLEQGDYVIAKSSSRDGFEKEIELIQFTQNNTVPIIDPEIYLDFTVEQGVKYKYNLYKKVASGYSLPAPIKYYLSKHEEQQDKDINNMIAEFEDAFLFDGEKQLRIRYNPKVSSFKSNVLESKIDTLGGKYPTFFRNGNVGYSEFPISGLISRLMDEDGWFAVASQSDQRGLPQGVPYTNLDRDNFYLEREFKMEVLKWLQNGKPKLFRSPAEGNYIVRLMNVSLSPNDTLSRMLHTFNCTAYEIAEVTPANLKKYNFIKQPELISNSSLLAQTISYSEITSFGSWKYFYNCRQVGDVYYIRIEGGPATEKLIYYWDGTTTTTNENIIWQRDWKNPIVGISYPDMPNIASLTLGYLEFSQNQNVFQRSSEAQQLSGFGDTSADKTSHVNINTDIRTEQEFKSIVLAPKPILQLVYKDSVWVDENGNIPTIQNVYTYQDKYYIFVDIVPLEEAEEEPPTEEMTLPYNCQEIDRTAYQAIINGQLIQIEPKNYSDLIAVDHVNEFKIGPGVQYTVSYNKIITTYNVEVPPKLTITLLQAKNKWEKNPTQENYSNYLTMLSIALEGEADADEV